MILHYAVLLSLFVIEQLGTGYLASTDKPTVFREIAKDIRLTGTLGCQFYNIETRLNKDKQTA